MLRSMELSDETVADVTRRLVAPLIGGITVSFVMELLVYPVIFYLYKAWQLRREWAEASTPASPREAVAPAGA